MRINKKLVLQIKEMFDVDQDLRKQGAMNAKLTQPLFNLCQNAKNTKKGSNLGLGLANFMVYIIDAVHNYRILRIIEKYGYPVKKLIGKEIMFYFFVLIQHQDHDLELQEQDTASTSISHTPADKSEVLATPDQKLKFTIVERYESGKLSGSYMSIFPSDEGTWSVDKISSQ